MSEKIPTEKLKEAFKFICFANERGGYMAYGKECTGIPFLEALISRPEEYTHLHKQPQKEMWQIWRAKRSGAVSAFPATDQPEDKGWLPVGEPFEFTFPEEDD